MSERSAGPGRTLGSASAAVRGADQELDLAIRLLDVCPDCVKFISPDGRILHMNPSGACLLEVDDVGSVRDRKWTELWPVESRASLEQCLDEAAAGRTGRHVGFCPTAKGTGKWWDVAVSATRDAMGRVKWFLAMSRDVTGAKSLEQRIQQSEQRFRVLADNMAQLAWMCAPNGDIFWYNQRWFDYSGTTLEQMAGWGWMKIHHPAHIDAVVAKFQTHLASGEDWEDTFPLRGADGTFRWFLSRARPIRDAGGSVVMWCGTNTDVTDQRAASARLRQKARLIELSHEAILVWDMEGGIVSWNRGCEELYGYDRSEAVGKKSHDLLRTKHSMPVDEFERHISSRGSWSGELCHTAKDGTEVWVDSRQEALIVEGRRLVLETNRDITGKRKATEIRDLLIGELNHRVKNTLAIVQSIAAQTARRSRDLRQFTSDFNERLQSLSAAQNVLTEANWAGADLHAIIQSQIIDPVGPSPAISFTGPKLTLGAQTAMQLSLVLHELVSNARKHGALKAPDGRLAITWTVVGDAPGRLDLSWRETGGPIVSPPLIKGFGMTLIERMGNQPNLTVSQEFEPGGVVTRIVADVQSKEFDAEPYFNPGRGEPTKNSTAHVTQPILRVLVIEDEPLIAMDIEGILSDAGMRAIGPAASVADALLHIQTDDFDIALLDGNLMGSPVDEVAAALSDRQKPFVFVTGFTRESLPAGFEHVGVIKKPVHPEALVQSVRTLQRN